MRQQDQHRRKLKRQSKSLAKARLQSTEYAKGNAQRPPKKRKRRSKAQKRRASYNAYIKSEAWQLFRFRILAERGRQCQKCGRAGGIMDVHHLHYLTFKHERPEDVVVWCRACHMRHHGH